MMAEQQVLLPGKVRDDQTKRPSRSRFWQLRRGVVWQFSFRAKLVHIPFLLVGYLPSGDVFLTTNAENSMRRLTKTFIATAFMVCTFPVIAATDGDVKPPPLQRDSPPMMGPAPLVYGVVQQTTTPVDALNTVVKNLPALETGKRYEVRLEVRELAPAPPVPPTP